MFDLSLLLQRFTARDPRSPEAGDAGRLRGVLVDRFAERPARAGERVFTDALSGLGHPLNAG